MPGICTSAATWRSNCCSRGVSADPDRLARFEREARVLAALNHPNVATLFGFERDDSGSTPFLVMELVEGETLAERIDRGPVPFSEARRIFIQIAEGLEAAHEQGIVHRDLKPANLKLSSDAQGGPLRVKVIGLRARQAPRFRRRSEPRPLADSDCDGRGDATGRGHGHGCLHEPRAGSRRDD